MAKTKAVDRFREYLDYSTVHGLGRLKNSPHVILKVLWCLFILASLTVIIVQLTSLLERYNGHPISTTIELDSPDEVPFPVVTVCNTNPVNYMGFSREHPLERVIDEANAKYSIGPYQDDDETAETNNTGFLFDSDILWYTLEKFRMIMSLVDTEALVDMSHSVKEFILLCDFAGMPCTMESLVPVRTYEYGMCYSILPEYQPGQNGSRHVTASGKKFGLELLLNVDSDYSVPFVSPSNGVYVMTNDANVTENGSMYLHSGVVVPTGFQANIGVYLTEEHRVPGKTGKIRCSNTNVNLADCMHNCQHDAIIKTCGCYRHFFKLGAVNATTMNATGYVPCRTKEHYKCIVDTENEHVKNTPADCKKCKVPCNERYYKRDVFISSWPNKGYMPILQNIVKTINPYRGRRAITRDFVRDNLLTVRVYLETLTHQSIIEEYSYLLSNFVSDIGGTFGFWAGFSALSLLEIIELVLLLFPGCKGKNKVQDVENKAPNENKTSVHSQENPGKAYAYDQGKDGK